MAITREQRRRMARDIARMQERQSKAATRPAKGPTLTPEATDGFAAEGAVSEDAPARTPSQRQIDHVAGRMWWAAQAQPERADQILRARETMLRESVLA